jgi:hypothetical protein
MSETGPTPRDALNIAQEAMKRITELEQTVQDQQERIEALEAAQPDRSDYKQLDRETKVGMVKEHLIKKAKDQHGKAAIDYDAVMWEVFDGEPSADHCYTLMQKAANEDGFGMRDPPKGNRQITVDLERTNTETRISHANKDAAGGDN